MEETSLQVVIRWRRLPGRSSRCYCRHCRAWQSCGHTSCNCYATVAASTKRFTFFFFDEAFDFPCKLSFPCPPFRGTPFLTAAFGLARGSSGAKASSQTSGALDQPVAAVLGFASSLSPLQFPASTAPMLVHSQSSNAAEYAGMSIVTCKKKLARQRKHSRSVT